jgi:hypothetical protein
MDGSRLYLSTQPTFVQGNKLLDLLEFLNGCRCSEETRRRIAGVAPGE